MQVTKEQIFFCLSLLLVGLLTWSLVSDPYAKKSARPGPRMEALEAPSVALSPSGPIPEDWWSADRTAFREPREWGPLPPVGLERPPLREPSMVPPSPAPGLGLAEMGGLRTRSKPTEHTFADAQVEGSAGGADEGLDAAVDAEGDDPERRTDAEVWRTKYDWLEVTASSRPMYGVIANENKYTLKDRSDEAIRFRRVDPETGRVSISGTIQRDQIRPGGIHLADNQVNRIERHILSIPRSQWGHSTLPQLLDLVRELMQMEAEEQYQFVRAEEELQKYLEIDAEAPQIYALLADARRLRMDFEGELAALEAAQERGLDSAELTVRWSRWYRRYGASQHARGLLESALARGQSDRDLYVELGRIQLDAGEGEAAMESFRQAQQLSRASERQPVSLGMGAAAMALGDAPAAVKEAERVLALNPDQPDGLNLLGAARFALGEFQDARTAFSDAANVAEGAAEQARALIGMGLCDTRLDDFDDAEQRLQYAMEVDPTVGGPVWRGLCWLYEATGHGDQALSAARRAMEFDPGNAYGCYLLGRQLRRDGDLGTAQEWLRRALERGASFPDLFAELGHVAFLSGEGDAAQRYHRESVAREPRDEARSHLGHVLLAEGDLVQARREYEAMKPSSESALGLAYCAYLRGESSAAKQRWQTVLNEMTGAPAEDRSYAQNWLDVVLDRESKERWQDFIRWQGVGKGWELEERFGVQGSSDPGRFRFRGSQRSGTSVDDWTVLHRPVERRTFHELNLEVEVATGHEGLMAVGLVEWIGGFNQDKRPRAGLLIGVLDGELRWQQRRSLDDPAAQWQSLGPAPAAVGESFRLGLRRLSQEQGEFQFLVDGVPTGPLLEMNQWRGRGEQELAALFLTSAEAGRRVDVSMRSAEIVRYRQEP